MQKLIDLGFKKAATITQDGLGGIQINVTQLANAKNILYAFITRQNEDDVDHWRVLYIGHSRKTFRNRMSGYQYGNGAGPNNRVHNAVRDHLNTKGNQVEVHVFVDRLAASIQGLPLDMPAGLEYALISWYRDYNYQNEHPRLLNKAGNPPHGVAPPDLNQINQAAQEEAAEQLEEAQVYLAPPPAPPQAGEIVRADAPLCQFVFSLTPRTYWPLPVINVSRICEQHFGPHHDVVIVELIQNNEARAVNVTINRTANINNTPRLWFSGQAGLDYTAWKQACKGVNEQVTVEVVGRNHIRLSQATMPIPHASWAHCYDFTYEKSYGHIYQRLTNLTIDSIKELKQPPCSLVDFGAGTGRLSIPLAQAGYVVTAVEPCQEMADILAAKGAPAGVQIRTHVERMQDFNSQGQFDIALCVFTVLLYLPDEVSLRKALVNLAQSLRKGGHLLIDIPTRNAFQSLELNTDVLQRTVTVAQIGGSDTYSYEESSRCRINGEWTECSDEFEIRYWQPALILKILRENGVECSEPDEEFRRTGSEYYSGTKVV